MVFDVEIEDEGILYECGIMERQANEATYFSVDIRIPGRGDTLNIQLHSLELHLDPYSGTFKFRDLPADTPDQILSLETKLHEAIMNVNQNGSMR